MHSNNSLQKATKHQNFFSSPSKHNTPTKQPRDDPLPHMGLTLPTQNEKFTLSELLALEETPNPKTMKKVQQLQYLTRGDVIRFSLF
jgi:hypothetical protein